MAFNSKMPAKKAAIKSTVIMISGKATAARGEEARKCTVSMEIISTNYAPKRHFIFGRTEACFSTLPWYSLLDPARAVAQLGRALRSGRRGRGFKSHQPDHSVDARGERVPKEALFLSAGGRCLKWPVGPSGHSFIVEWVALLPRHGQMNCRSATARRRIL